MTSGAAPVQAQPVQHMTKVLYDTDIGSDIDDAVALAYLLAEPRCELLGVTTVSGQARERAMLASALCLVAGKPGLPIYPGVERPLLLPTLHQPAAQQAEALTRWPHATTFPEGEAVEFLRRTIRAHPGEVELLATGPMTNIALLFSCDPAIPSLLKGLTLMCGSFSAEQRQRVPVEWNALCDPHAAALVYRAPASRLRSLGLDVTMQAQMRADAVRQRFAATPLLRPVLDFAEVWFRERDRITFHDPLAAVSIFDPDVCGYEQGAVEVELRAPDTLGATIFHPGPPTAAHLDARCDVAITVDPRRFFERYFAPFAPD